MRPGARKFGSAWPRSTPVSSRRSRGRKPVVAFSLLRTVDVKPLELHPAAAAEGEAAASSGSGSGFAPLSPRPPIKFFHPARLLGYLPRMPRNLDASTIAARTRAAQQILDHSDLREVYESVGGLPADLEAIRDAGLAAEAQLLAQSSAKSAGSAATLDVLTAFAALQKEYVAVMAAVQASRRDLEKANAAADVLAEVDRILVNEAQVVVSTTAQPDGSKKRKASRSMSQEALRAEIAKDAAALLALGASHDALAARKVTKERLEKLHTDAEALSGKLAVRTVKKGEQKAMTAARADTVADHSAIWQACYRLLALAGQNDARISALLRDAARPKKSKAT